MQNTTSDENKSWASKSLGMNNGWIEYYKSFNVRLFLQGRTVFVLWLSIKDTYFWRNTDVVDEFQTMLKYLYTRIIRQGATASFLLILWYGAMA